MGPHVVAEVATRQVAHDDEGATWLAPVVVDRHDVWVLQARDALGLALEPSDEVRVVGQLRVDHLDRDVASDLRLVRPVRHAQRPGPQPLEQPVAAQWRALWVEGGVLVEDALLDQL